MYPVKRKKRKKNSQARKEKNREMIKFSELQSFRAQKNFVGMRKRVQGDGVGGMNKTD